MECAVLPECIPVGEYYAPPPPSSPLNAECVYPNDARDSFKPKYLRVLVEAQPIRELQKGELGLHKLE